MLHASAALPHYRCLTHCRCHCLIGRCCIPTFSACSHPNVTFVLCQPAVRAHTSSYLIQVYCDISPHLTLALRLCRVLNTHSSCCVLFKPPTTSNIYASTKCQFPWVMPLGVSTHHAYHTPIHQYKCVSSLPLPTIVLTRHASPPTMTTVNPLFPNHSPSMHPSIKRRFPFVQHSKYL